MLLATPTTHMVGLGQHLQHGGGAWYPHWNVTLKMGSFKLRHVSFSYFCVPSTECYILWAVHPTSASKSATFEVSYVYHSMFLACTNI